MELVNTPPCRECEGKCCQYVAIEIGKPASKTDYDHIRWYLYHKNTNVFIDHDKKWYVEFRTPCEEQDVAFNCKIYKKRPGICRKHGNLEGECEYYDSPYLKYFSNNKEFLKYLKEKNIDWEFKQYK